MLRYGARGAGALGLGLFGGAIAVPVAHAAGADDFGPLQEPDSNGLQLPVGFTSRVVATTGVEVATTGYVWPTLPDGGATFPTGDGGWVYVSNSEASPGGGVGAIRFASDGTITDAYSILSGTRRNCAGGPTPWNTWLSCEEVDSGLVYECDPFTPFSQGVVRPALGVFKHEAAAVDSTHSHVYLTEDKFDGRLYRFAPSVWPNLTAGVLEVAQVLDPGMTGPIRPGETRGLAWHVVPDPSAAVTPTRLQVAASTAFNGGEGCWFESDQIFFSTKGDSRVWRIDTVAGQIEILYDLATSATPELTNPDNVFASSNGDVYVAEDPGNLQVVALTPSGGVLPIIQVTGQAGSEITGPACSPGGNRLYFSSQRSPGTTYEVTGPFLSGAPAVPSLGAIGQGLVVVALAAASYAARPQSVS